MGDSHADSQPAFTVVVPAFNAARTLGSSMDSVLVQTVSDLELIVVDDGSTDETHRIAASAEDPRVRVISQDNAGLSAARNAGTIQAKGAITAYLDSDDLLLPTYLEVVRDTFATNPGVDFVYTDAFTFNDSTRRIRRATTAYFQRPPRPAPQSALGLFRELVKRNFMLVPVAVRTDVIRVAGLFDEHMTATEDWDMWLRLTVSGHRGAEAPGPLGLRREHSAQMSSNIIRQIENQVYALEKLLAQASLSDADRRLVAASLQRTRVELGIVAGDRRVRSAARRGRHLLGRVRRRLDPSRGWYRVPPPAVSSAFPDLERL